MLQLESARLVGKGLHRECYEYPGDPTRCIKVVVAGNSDENRREARYYALLAARGISWEMLSRFYGLEDTLALPALRAYLLRDRVVTMTLKSKNILLQMTTGKSGRLVIVDNVGNSDFIPLSNYIGLLARAKIRRKWRRFEADLLTQNPDNMVLRRILRK
jgi:hypothetical protein